MKEQPEKAAIIHQNATNDLYSITVNNLSYRERNMLIKLFRLLFRGIEVFNQCWMVKVGK